MLYLKSANLEDIEKEYEFITNTPSNENGFTNLRLDVQERNLK